MRLSQATLARLPAAVRRPSYDRAAVAPGIVHLGIGAFHRAHQALFVDDLLSNGATEWGIIGSSLRSPATHDALAPQDGLYTIETRASGATDHRIIGSIIESCVAPQDPAHLIARMALPSVRMVTLTVTEKGYCHVPQTGELDTGHPDIVHDIAHPDAPRSAPGFIVAALARRKTAGAGPFTVVPCDNLATNGQTARRAVVGLAARQSQALADWIAANVTFPSTMVDRIVPETTAADRAAVDAALGMTDAWPVVTEPFIQWIIEDEFCAGRPPLDAVGAQFVSDVTPFEHMKLRLLNASHSGLAYLGYLAGYETIAQAMADPDYAAFARRLMAESAPTLTMPAGTDLSAYCGSLLTRFANTALKHRTWQIAMDGSQKLPQRLLHTIADRLAMELPIDTHALAVAGWMRYVTATDENGRPIDVRDPLAAELAAIAGRTGPVAAALAPALLAVRAVFGDLGGDGRVRSAVSTALGRIYAEGARRTVAGFMAGARS